MKINVKNPRKIHKISMSGKLYGKLILTLPELAAYVDDEVRVTLEVSRINPDAVPN